MDHSDYIKTYDLLGNSYSIKNCTAEDIPKHFELVSDFITDVDHDIFKDKMLDCVNLGTAFALDDDSCFLYYAHKVDSNRLATGIAIYGNGVPNKIMALFIGIFDHIDKDTVNINFYMHTGKMIQEYKSIVTIASIERSCGVKRPLSVRVDHLKDKIHKLQKLRGS